MKSIIVIFIMLCSVCCGGVLKVYDGSVWQEVPMVTDHGILTGLGDDDHTHYILADGSRNFTASETFDAGAIFNGDVHFDGTDAGKDWQWDKSAHSFVGLDNVIWGQGNTAAAPDVWTFWDGDSWELRARITGTTPWNIGTVAQGIDIYLLTTLAGDFVHFDWANRVVNFTDVDFKIGSETFGGTILFGANNTIEYDAANNDAVFGISSGRDWRIDSFLLFTQVDENEAIGSAADGYMDYKATTAHRFNRDVVITGNMQATTIGIGTASPDRDLEIRNASPVIRLRDTGATANATTSFIEFGGTDAGVWSRTCYVGDGSSGNTDMYIQAEISDLHLGDSSSNSVMNLQGGNVGIGLSTVDANYKLIVRRAADINLGVGLQSSELAIAAFNDALSANVPMRFYASEFNFVNGNVGIGTTTPAGKLSINGGLHVGGDSNAGDNNLLVDGNIVIATGGNLSLGSTQWDNGSDAIDGEQIANNTIDADSLDVLYAAGATEAGAATTGDTATAFFSAGTIEHERGGAEADVSAYSGLLAISTEFKLTVTIDNTKVAGDETDFPVLITEDNLPDEFFLRATETNIHCESFGQVALSRELAHFDATAKEIELWVKIPSLSSSADTVFYIYYGDETLSETDAVATWDDNFELVLHMQEDAQATSAAMDDSTTNGNDGTVTGNCLLTWEEDATVGTDLNMHDGFCVATIDGVDYFYLSGNSSHPQSIKKYDTSWNVLVTNTSIDTDVGLDGSSPPAGFAFSVSDIDIYDGKIYAACGYYKAGEVIQSPRFGVWNADDLSFREKHDIAETFVYSSVTVDGANDRMYLPEYLTAGGSDIIYAYEVSTYDYKSGENVTLSSGVETYSQGLLLHETYFYLMNTDELRQYKFDGTSTGILYTGETNFYQGLDYIPWTGQIGILRDPGATEVVHLISPQGQVYNGAGFDGVSDYLNCGSDSSLQMASAFTVTGWINLDVTTGDTFKGIAAKGITNDRSFVLALSSDNTNLLAGYEEEGGANHFQTGSQTIPLDTWVYVGVTWTGTAIQLYYNGSTDGSSLAASAAVATSGDCLVGNQGTAGVADWDGLLDEVQISSSARSANWISTSYQNLNAPSAFYSITALVFGTFEINEKIELEEQIKDVAIFAVTEAGSSTLSGAGAIPLTAAVCEWTTTGANAGTLADGTAGQILTVVIVTDSGEGTLTPTTATGWATAVFTDDIDTASFMYVDGTVGWIVLGTGAAAGNAVALTQ